MHMQSKILISYVNDILTNALGSLKDEDFQRRVWFHQQGAEVSSYIDCTTHFLDRCESIFKLQDAEESLGVETNKLLKTLYELISIHVDDTENKMDPYEIKEEELLNDPKWHDIQTMAEEAYIKLKEFIEKQK